MDKTRDNILKPENSAGGNVLLERFAAAFARTGEFRRIAGALAPQAVEVWAGKSRIKKALTRPVSKSIQKGFSVSGYDGSPVAELFADEEFLSSVSREIPEIINGVLSVFESAVSGAARLSPEERARMLEELTSGIDMTKTGNILTGLMVLVNGVHEHNPRFFNDSLRPKIVELIESTDFGEIKEALEGSREDISALVKTVNEEFWKYPAKFVLLLSLIPLLINIIISAVKETVEPVNRLAPDLLADVVISLLRDIDTETTGTLINELCEVLRKVHTGSALIGDPGKPALPAVLAELTSGTLNSVDVKLFFKARDLLNELKESSLISFMSALEENPDIARDFLRGYFRSSAAFFRNLSRRSELFESFSDAELAEEFENGAGQIDAQEIGVTISRFCGILNRVHEHSPGIIKNSLAQTVSSVDSYEAGETVKWLTSDIVESLKPLAPEIMPPVIRGIADLIKSGEDSEDMKDAVNYLRTVLNAKEESK